MTREIVGAGTPEAEWSSWLPTQAVPPADLAPLLGAPQVVVLAAHPDDEVLGIGGLVSTLAAADVPLVFVWATDGEGSHPDAAQEFRRRLPGLRRAESAAALDRLGVPAGADRHHLGLPDTALAAHEDEVAAALADLVGPGDVLLAPWSEDGHPDHETCGRAARTVAREHALRLLEYPIWLWHWAVPGDPRVPWTRLVGHDLTVEAQAAKQAAVAEFGSQITPAAGPGSDAVLPPEVLAHFARSREVLFP